MRQLSIVSLSWKVGIELSWINGMTTTGWYRLKINWVATELKIVRNWTGPLYKCLLSWEKKNLIFNWKLNETPYDWFDTYLCFIYFLFLCEYFRFCPFLISKRIHCDSHNISLYVVVVDLFYYHWFILERVGYFFIELKTKKKTFFLKEVQKN